MLRPPLDGEIERFCTGNGPVFLFLGALCKRKGIDVLLKALVQPHGEHSLRLFQDFTPQRNAWRLIESVHTLGAMERHS
jgi:hypothetical protein